MNAPSTANKAPFRADQVGSLLRPPELRLARERYKRNEITAAQLRLAEDEAIRDAVKQQEAIGIQAVTDGEFRRDWWHLDFLALLDGVELVVNPGPKFQNSEEQPPIPRVTGKVGCSRPIMVEDFKFLASVTKNTPKFTIPSPSMLHLRGGRSVISQAVYPDAAQFWVDVSAAYKVAIQHLYDAGCRYLQLDDVSFAYLCDEGIRATCVKNGDDPDVLPFTYANAINQALIGRRETMPDLRVTMHTCRGNFKSTFVASGAYSANVMKAMYTCDVDAFFMEFDSQRSGGFEILKGLPAHQQIVLGLVTTKLGELETSEQLQARIAEAGQYVPLGNLCLSPQCGFSSTHHGNHLSYDEQWKKLQRIVQVAQQVWK
jgi:5-methyltetrahydropteroyltriglutamate--homocysteine methyltransferase